MCRIRGVGWTSPARTSTCSASAAASAPARTAAGPVSEGAAATYLRAAGVGQLVPLPAPRGPGKGEGSDARAWRDLLSNVDLVVRSGFDDDAMSGVAAALGLPVIAVRAQADVVDSVSFARRPPTADATATAPFVAAAPSNTGPAAVLAGALAAAEALQVLVRAGDVHPTPRIRHMRLPLDGREPLAQEIGHR